MTLIQTKPNGLIFNGLLPLTIPGVLEMNVLRVSLDKRLTYAPNQHFSMNSISVFTISAEQAVAIRHLARSQ